MICFNCQTEITLSQKLKRNETCPKCASYLHCCRNCKFHDQNAHNQCLENQADWVKDKEMGNFCEYFEPASKVVQKDNTRKDDALKKLNDLFKKS